MTDFIQFILDQLNHPPYLSVRKLFGEHCLFYHGKILAIVGRDDRIYLKTNADTLPYFQQVGSVQFSYNTSKGVQKMHYWTIPDIAIEEPDELKCWFNLGLKAV